MGNYKLTLIIPTYNRELYGLKLHKQWSKKKNVKIHYLDGSKIKFQKK